MLGGEQGSEPFAERPHVEAEDSLICLRGLAARATVTLRDSSHSSRPQEIPLRVAWSPPNGPTAFFVIRGERAAKMPLKRMKVNLWKNPEVS
jgi:hypothetical protein